MDLEMMNLFRSILLGGGLILVLAGAGLAQSVTEQVIDQLQRQGFEIEETNRTLLGRVRIIAERNDFTREIVFDPRNGEILRDYSYSDDGEAGIWGFRRDDDDDDDREDARDDDDRDDRDDRDDDDDDDDGDEDSDDDDGDDGDDD